MQQPTALLDPAEARSGQLLFSKPARAAIVAACRRGRRQAVLLSWPAGATYLPRECYQQGEFDVVVGHMAGCPIYADVRQLALFPDRRILLDADHASRERPHPPLRARVMSPSPPPAADQGPSSPEDSFVSAAVRVTGELTRDLDEQFAGAYPVTTIRAHVRRAIQDLRGSVSVGALPEMAARLARHRLSHGEPHGGIMTA